jgi:hypothetical protein
VAIGHRPTLSADDFTSRPIARSARDLPHVLKNDAVDLVTLTER